MGIPAAATTPRPCPVRPRGQAGDLPAAVGSRRSGHRRRRRPRHRLESRCHRRRPPPLARAPAAVAGGPAAPGAAAGPPRVTAEPRTGGNCGGRCAKARGRRGYVFTVRSIARPGAYRRRRTGIAVGVDRLRRLVHRQGFAVGRPAHTLKGKRDEGAYSRTRRRRLDRLKKGRRKRARPTSCGTPTPPNSTCCRTWCDA